MVKNRENLPVIDCDVHQRFRHYGQELIPYIPPAYRDRAQMYGVSGSAKPSGATSMNNGGDRGFRADSWPEDGSVAGSDLELMRKQLLDAYDMDYAILLGQEIFTLSTLTDADWAAVLASAYNQWLIDHWLEADERLKGGLYVSAQEPVKAAAEIRRLGSHPDIVQVLVCAGTAMKFAYGNRFYDPIYEACVEMGLPFAMHIGGTSGSPVGEGSYYTESRQSRAMCFMGHLASYVFEGTFERFPDLKVVFVEGGYVWLPTYLWRLDSDWKGLREQTPWVKRLPSEYVFEHCYFTTQPMETGDSPEQLVKTFEWGRADQILLFCTDYPHWDFDSPHTALPTIDEHTRRRVLAENARELYRLPVK